MNFKSFFSKVTTPHTREHQQSLSRSFNRKHLNMVPYSKNDQKAHPYITTLLKNKTPKNEKMPEELALSILQTYGHNIDKEGDKNFIRSINTTGIEIKKDNGIYYIIYNPDK